MSKGTKLTHFNDANLITINILHRELKFSLNGPNYLISMMLIQSQSMLQVELTQKISIF